MAAARLGTRRDGPAVHGISPEEQGRRYAEWMIAKGRTSVSIFPLTSKGSKTSNAACIGVMGTLGRVSTERDYLTGPIRFRFPDGCRSSYDQADFARLKAIGRNYTFRLVDPKDWRVK